MFPFVSAFRLDPSIGGQSERPHPRSRDRATRGLRQGQGASQLIGQPPSGCCRSMSSWRWPSICASEKRARQVEEGSGGEVKGGQAHSPASGPSGRKKLARGRAEAMASNRAVSQLAPVWQVVCQAGCTHERMRFEWWVCGEHGATGLGGAGKPGMLDALVVQEPADARRGVQHRGPATTGSSETHAGTLGRSPGSAGRARAHPRRTRGKGRPRGPAPDRSSPLRIAQPTLPPRTGVGCPGNAGPAPMKIAEATVGIAVGANDIGNGGPGSPRQSEPQTDAARAAGRASG